MKPLAVSMGDPAGIGLELAARMWADRSAPAFFLVGDPGAFERASARLGLPTPRLKVAADASEIGYFDHEILSVLLVPLVREEIPGTPHVANAQPIIRAVELGVEAVRLGSASALVTLPVAKSVLQEAGFGFPGHTEFVAHLTHGDAHSGARGPVMMLAGPQLKVALATIHTPLAEVPAQITSARIAHVGRVAGEALRRDFGVAKPRLALCGFNPHAGENGRIGREELDIINPAAAILRSEGWDIGDAKSADSLFHEGARVSYDAAIAIYHDQGLIPIKTLHFWDAVNVTLGLPIVRTSPDHGVGFDIAGKGVARADSFRAALHMAAAMAARRASA